MIAQITHRFDEMAQLVADLGREGGIGGILAEAQDLACLGLPLGTDDPKLGQVPAQGVDLRQRRRGPWRNMEAIEFATLEWVDWYNTRRRLEPIGNMPPAEAEARYYAQLEPVAM